MRVFILMAAMIAMAGCGAAPASINEDSPGAGEPGASPAAAAAPDVLMAAPDLDGITLRDPGDHPVPFVSLRGKPALLTFIYTRCPMPEMCPATTLRFQQVQKALTPEDRTRVRLISVSFDPAYDTPEVLAEYADLWEVDETVWTLLTGAEADVRRVAEAHGVWYEKAEGDTFRHPMYTLVLLPDGALHQVLLGSVWDAAEIAELLRDIADVGSDDRQ